MASIGSTSILRRVPGKILDFCRAVPPGHGFRLANGVYETIDALAPR